MFEETSQAKFNSGLAKLERIHKIRLRIIESRMLDDLENWADALNCWRSEIDYTLSDEESERAEKIEQKIDVLVLDEKQNATLYNELKKYNLILGKLEHKYGLGMPKQATNSEAASIV